MGKRKKGLTLEEHIELGAKMKRLNKELREVANTIISAYGKTSQAGSRSLRAVTGVTIIDKLCVDMDNIVVRETDRREWDSNGYGWIYMGGDMTDTFRTCTQCGRYVLGDRAMKSVTTGGALCPMCYE